MAGRARRGWWILPGAVSLACGYAIWLPIKWAADEAKAEREQRAAQIAAALEARGYEPFENCDEARAYGAAPVYESDLRYGYWLDRDADGIGCEKWK